MELSTERRLVKSALLVSILCGTMWLAVWSFLGTLDSQNDVILGSKIAISGFGEINLFNPQTVGLFSTNIYQDTQLGFQISKPNNDWEIHSTIDDMNRLCRNHTKLTNYL